MKNYILSIAAIAILSGCTVNQEPKPVIEPVVEKNIIEVTNPYDEDKLIAEKKTFKKKTYKKKSKPKGIYYRMVSNKVEAFLYKGRLSGVSKIDDKRIKNSFYIKGNLVRIEKILTSKLGDRYGKISGKNYLVSMDDLTTYTKK